MGALEDLANTPEQPQSGGSALEALANSPDTSATHPTMWQQVKNALAPRPVPHATNAEIQASGMPGSFEGHPENIGEYVPASAGEIAGGTKDIAQGNVAKGAHRVISGAMNAAAPVAALTLPAAVMAAPVTTALSVGGAAVGQKLAQKGAESLGATPDQQDLAGDVGGLVGGGVPFAGRSAVKAVKNLVDVPAAISKDASSTLAVVAHNDGLPPLQATDAREAAAEIQKAYVTKAKDFYAPVDKAVDGNLKPVQERIAQLKQAYDYQKDVNPELADKQLTELGQQYQKLGQLVEKAKAAGVPNAEQLMAQGDRYYTKGMAMKEVSSGIKTASGVAKMDGKPHPTLFANQIDKLYNKGTLSRALGDDGAKAMLETAKAGYSKGKTVSAVKSVAKKSIPYVAGGAALGAAGVGVAKTLSGQ